MGKLKYIRLYEDFTDEPKTIAQLIASDEIPSPKGYKPSQNTNKKGTFNIEGDIVAWIDKEDGYYRSENTKQKSSYQGGKSKEELLFSLKKHGYEHQPLLPCEVNPKTNIGYGS